MKRWALVIALALLVTLPIASAINSCMELSMTAGSSLWIDAALDTLQAAVSLMLALGVLAIVEDPRARRPLWLLDWRAFLRRRHVSAADTAQTQP